MTRRRIILLRCISLLLVLFFASCAKEEGTKAEKWYLSLATEEVDFTGDAGSREINISTNLNNWTASVTAGSSWLSAVKDANTLVLTVEENATKDIREGTVEVSSDYTETKSIRVRQLGYELAILVSPSSFTVEAAGEVISFEVTTNVSAYETSATDWIVAKTKTRSAEYVSYTNEFVVSPSSQENTRTGEIVISDKNGEAESQKVVVSQRGLGTYYSTGTEDVKDDIKLTVKSAEASSQQSAGGTYSSDGPIEYSFDGDMSTLYHSAYDNSGSNYFPITLIYYFDEGTCMDYLIYYPRQSGSNGLFKEVEIWVLAGANTKGADEWTLMVEKDFGGSSSAARVDFPESQIDVSAVKFVVKSGAGDGQGFASCAEMEFYQKNPDSFDYSSLFTDKTCSELKAGITETDISSCEYSFYKNIAWYMYNSMYPSEFRIQEYKAYPHPDNMASENRTTQYSLLDNPTGIAVSSGDVLVAFVGDMNGRSAGIKVQNLDVSGGDGFGGTSYALAEGENKLTMSSKGLVYVTYYADDFEDAPPIKIHFASGTVNGYFDSQKHSGRWSELLKGASNKYFDVVGKYAHLTFETADFRTYAATTGEDLIDLYDQIVLGEMRLMGLEKYDRMFRNRMYCNVIYTSYMYATSYHTAYNQTTMSNVCSPSDLKSSPWGPAHEIGHMNQTSPGVKWLGMTEVTNNIMSEYVQTTLFGNDSRIQTEDMGEIYRNRYSEAWTEIIAAGRAHRYSDSPDVFAQLVPFWQLELYFGRVLGQTPTADNGYDGFYPKVYEYARTADYSGQGNGQVQLHFVYNCCLAAEKNLLDFFEKWGFLTPINVDFEDYSSGNLTVTEEAANKLRAAVEALGYEKPDVALEYISDNTVDIYKSKAEVEQGDDATKTSTSSGTKLTIKNWVNVAVYEIRKDSENGDLVFICSGETTSSKTDYFVFPYTWDSNYHLYAVSATGKRTEITIK